MRLYIDAYGEHSIEYCELLFVSVARLLLRNNAVVLSILYFMLAGIDYDGVHKTHW